MTAKDPIELGVGRWVKRRGVLVWDTTPEPLPAPVTRLQPPRPRLDLSQLIACPRCLVTVTQPCRSSGGFTVTPHRERLVSRRCLCGEPVAPRKQYCEACRRKARRRTYKLREIRKATRERRRVAS